MKSSLSINHKTHYDDRLEHKIRNRKKEDITYTETEWHEGRVEEKQVGHKEKRKTED